jgi:hypothetical protein
MNKTFPLIAVTLVALLLMFGTQVTAQNAIGTNKVLTMRNFPLLARIKADNQLARLIHSDRVLLNIQSIQLKRLTQALSQCTNVGCYTAALKWQPEDIKIIGNELAKLYHTNKIFRGSIVQLYKNGSYQITGHQADTALLRKAWNDEAKGINHILEVYFSGVKPYYAKIDSISFKQDDQLFFNNVRYALQHILNDKKNDSHLFFSTSLYAAMTALRLNGRNEAARYMPLNAGVNKVPNQQIKTTNWAKYPYSVILIPGLGPETSGLNLDPNGALRCAAGAERFRKGMAPFIVVSGGHVHPFKTPFNEAIEMKKYLVEKLGIPSNAVFIEPHARHTTTNLRNVNRIIYNFKIPAIKPVLIVTDSSQTTYMDKGMAKVALRDLGYTPYSKLKKLNNQETIYYPNWESLQVNANDPLDPQ